MTENNEFLIYKGKPLVRDGNTIYYGFPFEPYVAMLQIIGTAKEEDMEMATKVIVRIMATDESVKPEDRIIKNAEKSGLFEALNIASIWLEIELKKVK